MRTQPIHILLLTLLMVAPLLGQFYFGRNKIQYENFDWQVLTTEHFLIHYYSEEEWLARAAAFWAEEVFDELEIRFNHTFGRQVPLVIYSNPIHFQQTNTIPYLIPEGVGGFFEFIKGRVVLPHNGNLFDFRHVVRHELVHVFTHAKLAEAARLQGLWDRAMMPLWFTEGLAEWWSEGWDSDAEMVIRDAVLYDYLQPLQNLAFGGGYLVYKEGQSFLRYFEEHYGADGIRSLMEMFYQYDDITKVMAAVTGASYREVVRDWRFWLKQNFAPELARQDVPTRMGKSLTRSGAEVSPASYIDAQGERHLVYLSNREGYTHIFERNLDGGRNRRVVSGERRPQLESLHFLQSGLDVNHLGEVVFVSKEGGRDHLRIWSINERSLVASYGDRELTTMRNPAWSHDGRQVVFAAQDRAGKSDLYIWEAGADHATRLTHDVYLDRDPVFSPDDEAVVFSSDRGRKSLDGATNLYRLALADGTTTRLTQGPYQDRRPGWASDSVNRLMFISDRSGTPNIWSFRTDEGANLTQHTNLHTAVTDFLPLDGDSLILNTFAGYNFSFLLGQLDSVSTVSAPLTPGDSGWTTPIAGKSDGEDSQPYRLKYSLDIAQTMVASSPLFGFFGGAQLGLSDMLGNRYYHIFLANTAETTSEILSRFNVALTMVNLKQRLNWAVGAFRYAIDYGYISSAIIRPYFESTLGVHGALSYPVNVFRRIEYSTALWASTRDYYYAPLRPDHPWRATLWGNSLALVHDNSLWQATGPIDGWRLRLALNHIYDLQRIQVHNYGLLADLRTYFRPWPFLTFAQRIMAWYSEGNDRRRFLIGGSWGMRGYRFAEIIGQRFVMFNQELRFPIANSLVLRGTGYALGLAPIRGALFLDIGNAWDYEFRGLVGSYGFGLRGNILGALVLRLDFGRRTDFVELKGEPFTQFFFGWDY